MLNWYNLKHKKTDITPTPNSAKLELDKKKVNIGDYIDPDGELGNKGLKWGFWFISHKVILYKLSIIFLIVVITSSWGFSLYKFGNYLWDIPDQKKMEQELATSINYQQLNINYTASPLQILGVEVFKSGVDKFDIISDIANPNDKYIAYFDYSFYLSGQLLGDKKTTFLLPKENRPVVEMGIESKAGLLSPHIVIDNLRWKRISPHSVTDVKKWQDDHLDFKLDSFSFSSSYSADKTSPDANVISFNLTNSSPFSYIEPEFILSLYQSGNFVGVIPFKINNIFASSQIEKIDLRNFSPNLLADRAIVHSLIDIYTNSSYYNPAKK